MNLTYFEAIVVDVAALALAVGLLARHGRLSHSHPATIYLLFHVYSFTWRLIALAQGAVPLFAEPFWGPSIEPLREEELTSAALLADCVLLTMTVAWLWAARVTRGNPGVASSGWFSGPITNTIVNGVAAVAFPLGVFGLLTFARLPGLSNTESFSALGIWSTSSYVLILQSWAGLSLIALVYMRGFRWWLVGLVAVYLVLMAFQGFHRFRALIPSILLIQIYLDRHSLRWPNLRVTAVLLAMGFAFFPLKGIGRALQEGAPTGAIFDLAAASTIEVISGRAPDQTFLDQLASGKALVDRSDALFLGAPYLAVLTLPVPRQWWPEKPTLSWYLQDISRPSRPMYENGMVLTFVGDLYANFSYVGLLLVAPLFAFWLSRLYFAARSAGYWSIGHFAYLLLACNLLQVYRDGLVSLVMFTFVNMLPLTVIVVIHLITPRSLFGRTESHSPKAAESEPTVSGTYP